MKKKFRYFVITWSVLFALFNLIIFVTPNKILGVTRFDKPIFWVTYAFIVISLVGQLLTSYVVCKSNNLDKLFFNIPFINLGYIILVGSAIIAAVFMVLPILPTWICIIVCSLMFGVYIFVAVQLKAGVDIITEIDDKVKVKTEFYKLAVIDAQMIYEKAKNTEVVSIVKNVYEELKYSDSVSNSAVSNIENNIEKELKNLSDYIEKSKFEEAKTCSNNLLMLIKERSLKIKALK